MHDLEIVIEADVEVGVSNNIFVREKIKIEIEADSLCEVHLAVEATTAEAKVPIFKAQIVIWELRDDNSRTTTQGEVM